MVSRGGPLGPAAERAPCTLSASTVCSWLDQAGRRAEAQREGQYAGSAASGPVGADGLWARLRGGVVRVLLMVRDSASFVLPDDSREVTEVGVTLP